MKKLFLLAIVCCGLVSAYAEEPKQSQSPQTPAEAHKQAQEACEAWGKNAVPASNTSHTGVINYGSSSGSSNTSNSNTGGKAGVAARIFGNGVSGEVNHSNGNSNTQNTNNSSSNTLYYDCK